MTNEDAVSGWHKLGSVPSPEQAKEYWSRIGTTLTAEERRRAAIVVIAADKWLYRETVQTLLTDAFEGLEDPIVYLQEVQGAAGEEPSLLLPVGKLVVASVVGGLDAFLADAFRRTGLSPMAFAALFASVVEADANQAADILIGLIESAKTGREAAAIALSLAFGGIVVKASDPLRLVRGLKRLEDLIPPSHRQWLAEIYSDLSHRDPGRGQEELLRLCSSDGIVRFRMAMRVTWDSVIPLETRKAVLGILVRSGDRDIRNEAVLGLANVGKSDPAWAADLLIRLVEQNEHLRLGAFDYAVGELGKADLAGCLSSVEKMVRSGSKTMGYWAPDVATALASSSPHALLPWIRKWIGMDLAFRELALRACERLVSDHWRAEIGRELAAEVMEILQPVAGADDMNAAARITRQPPAGTDPVVLKSLALIQRLIHPKRSIDREDVRSGWSKSPGLQRFMGGNWLRKAIINPRPEHPLVYYLSDFGRSEEPWRQYSAITLENIESLLGEIDPGESGASELKDGLRNPEQFWQTVSEIEVIGRLRKAKIPVEIHPQIDMPESGRNRRLDAKAEVLGKDVYIEVATPQTYLPLELVRAGIGLPNRAVNIILDKVKDQFAGAAKIRGNPVVLAMNTTRSDINAYEIRDALHGQLKVSLLVERQTGNVVAQDFIREMNAISDKTPAGRVLSGVFVVKWAIEERLKVSGLWLSNKNPDVPLDQDVVTALQNILFDHAAGGESTATGGEPR